MVTILQYVTTYPIELMDCPRLATKIKDTVNPDTITTTPTTTPTITPTPTITNENVSSDNIKQFYQKDIFKYNTSTSILTLPNILTFNGPINDTTLKSFDKNKPSNIKQKLKYNYIDYNIIYNKLFEHNLNYIEKFSKNKTIIIFPTHDKSDNGKSELNTKYYPFYIDKFDKIQTNIIFKPNENVCYLDLKVYSTKTKNDYKTLINFEFNRIKNLIKSYNDNVTQLIRFGKANTSENLEIKNIVFILDLDKKNLFTGIYNRQLAKDKTEILSKEYSSFLSSQGFTNKSIEDSTINLTYKDFVSQTNVFKGITGISISVNDLSKETYENFILTLKNNYRQIIDKEFSKSLKEKDNVKKLSIFYRLKNVDKEIDDTILTGSNKIYTLTYKLDEKGKQMKDLKGYFTLISKERGIYNFIEDNKYYEIRTKPKKKEKLIEEEHANPENNNDEQFKVSDENVDKQNKNVKIKYKYGKILYETIKSTEDKIGRKGEVKDLIDKVSIEQFKWFRPKDLDLSLSEEKKIKYYDDILFDKNTLIEYIKSKKRFTDKTNLSYEFLKINDSAELIEYCDFIHVNFKNNIKEYNFNPFKSSFNSLMIKNNIIDIIFQPNNIIYTNVLTKTTEEQRDSSTKENYKIVDKKIFEPKDFDFNTEDKNICHKNKNKNVNNKVNIPVYNTDCSENYYKYINETPNSGIECKIAIVSITKMNVKDIDLLKKKIECKTKKINIKYKYKQLFKGITQKIGNYMIDPYKGGKLKRSTKRRAYKNTNN
jgi:hypothetical protein